MPPTPHPEPASPFTTTGTGKATVLCVDDEPGILSALKRTLRSANVVVLTATGGTEALDVMRGLPVDLVISDMRMPGMDGAQLLEHVFRDWPDTMRILLTGYSDTAATIQAVNRGRIFRYLQKPWDERELLKSVEEGLELRARLRDDTRLRAMSAEQTNQLRRVSEELQQLQELHAADRRNSDAGRQRHYLQSVKVLTNLLEVRSPAVFEHGRRVATLARDLARALGLGSEAVLDIFVAGLLHDICLVGLSEDVLRGMDGLGATPDDVVYRDHPIQSARALAALEDMLPVARLIEAHHERFDGSGFPQGAAGDAIPIGARVLAVANTVDNLSWGRSGLAPCSGEALAQGLRAQAGAVLDPAIVDCWVRSVAAGPA
jgi:response regulator RpfG family c-di-GMP phosphodiesterase